MKGYVKCAWCKNNTKPIYKLKYGVCLCPICAEKHYASINKKLLVHIEEIHKGLANRRKSIVRLKQELCNHENAFDTGYCKVFTPLYSKEIWKCPDCNIEILKEIIG